MSLDPSGSERRTPADESRGLDLSDTDAFSRALLRHRRRLEFWVSARMGPLLRARVSVDDAVQETLIEANRSRSSFSDRGSGSFQRWLFAIAENRLRDLHKYHTAQKRHPAREIAAAGYSDTGGPTARLAREESSVGTRVARTELAGLLVNCLDELPELLRKIVLARVVEECSYREIGERVAKSPTTVQGLYCRALMQLKRTLDAQARR